MQQSSATNGPVASSCGAVNATGKQVAVRIDYACNAALPPYLLQIEELNAYVMRYNNSFYSRLAMRPFFNDVWNQVPLLS